MGKQQNNITPGGRAGQLENPHSSEVGPSDSGENRLLPIKPYLTLSWPSPTPTQVTTNTNLRLSEESMELKDKRIKLSEKMEQLFREIETLKSENSKLKAQKIEEH